MTAGAALAEARAAIDRALADGDVAGAATLAAPLVAAGAAEPMLLNLVAWTHEEAGDLAAARALLARALAAAPRDATIVAAIGRVDRLDGDYGAALRGFAAASALEPAFAVPWLERGFALEAMSEVAAALAAYTRAAALDPSLAPAWAGAAAMAARSGDATAVADFAARAFALDPGNAVATCAVATGAIERGDAAAAATRLDGLLARGGLTAEDRIEALTLLGDARDKLGVPADAFAAWREAKSAFAAFHAPRYGDLEPQRQFIERLAHRVAAAPPAAWQVRTAPPGHGAARGHVFLIGYPRSGTTLTENILASSPDVVAVEERPTLADSDDFLIDDDGIDRLLSLDGDAISRLRDAYWARVAAMGVDAADKVFVDMNPMNGMKLPLVARLFPDARIVVMRRDPRDVVLSCFRQNFRVSASALAFTDLAETARHYDATMRLTQYCLETMPLAAFDLRYDALVGDFDRVTQALCAFLALEWSPDLRRFDRTAQRRGVTTASVGQVRRGLYDGGGRWRRYAAELAPALPILAPWVERFGFAR